jgi:hypothetical protein
MAETKENHPFLFLNGNKWQLIRDLLLSGTFIVDNTVSHCESASANVIPPGSSTAGTAIIVVSTNTWATLQSDGSYWRIIARGL